MDEADETVRVFTIDDMRKAYIGGFRNGGKARFWLSYCGELRCKYFDKWFSENFK